jgi:hypothetical protein
LKKGIPVERSAEAKPYPENVFVLGSDAAAAIASLT